MSAKMFEAHLGGIVVFTIVFICSSCFGANDTVTIDTQEDFTKAFLQTEGIMHYNESVQDFIEASKNWSTIEIPAAEDLSEALKECKGLWYALWIGLDPEFNSQIPGIFFKSSTVNFQYLTLTYALCNSSILVSWGSETEKLDDADADEGDDCSVEVKSYSIDLGRAYGFTISMNAPSENSIVFIDKIILANEVPTTTSGPSSSTGVFSTSTEAPVSTEGTTTPGGASQIMSSLVMVFGGTFLVLCLREQFPGSNRLFL